MYKEMSLKTFSELKEDTKKEIASETLKAYQKRINIILSRYWAHSKSIRRKYGLRHYLVDMYDIDFNASLLLSKAEEVIILAGKGIYPIDLYTMLNEKVGDLQAENLNQVTNWLNMNLNWIDEKIIMAEVKMQQNNEFNPFIEYPHKFEKLNRNLFESIFNGN